MNAFREMGLECFEPYGAFYVFPCIKEFGMTSAAGLYQSVFSFILVLIANRIVKKAEPDYALF